MTALEERNRVARDIHDSVTQLLFGAHLALRVAREGGNDQRSRAAVERGRPLRILERLAQALRAAGADKIYVSNLGWRGAAQRLEVVEDPHAPRPGLLGLTRGANDGRYVPSDLGEADDDAHRGQCAR